MRTLTTIVLLIVTGCYSEVDRDYRKEVISDAYSTNLKAGLASANKNDWTEAIKSFTDAIEVEETSVAFSNRALAYDYNNQPDKAIADHNRALELEPTNVGSLYNRGRFFVIHSEYEMAISDFDALLKVTPAHGPSYSERGRAYLALKRFRNTFDDFINAWRLDKGSVRTQGDLAWLLATCPDDSIRNGQDAVKFAQLAVTNSGGAWQYVDTLAAAYAENGDFEKAEEAQERAIELAPEDQRAKLGVRLKLFQGGKSFRLKARWFCVTDPPAEITSAAEARDRKMSAKPWMYEGIEPEVYTDHHGLYRVVWFADDPLRDTYPGCWYEVTENGQVVAAYSSDIPSALAKPSIHEFPNW